MGVAGLWDVLRPASKIRSLTDLAVTDGFEKNPQGVRGYRIGIDASIWSFHMEYGREGENPQLRTLFFRCATLMRCPFLPLFVFDGPKRPDFKRGKKISKTPHKLIPSMKQIIEAFGFEHRTAPGEAEAELAYLNQLGVIDGILSDDVDNFLFGATTVIRNPSNNLSGNKSKPVLNANGKDDKNHTLVFKSCEIKAEIGLTKGGFILIGLLSGGDYHTGLEKCGMKTAVGLAKCGFGDSLYQAAISIPREQLPAYLDNWRSELRHEIRTNSQGHIGRKSPSLANYVTNAFPNIDVLMSYVSPVTSETMGRPYCPGDIRWDKEPDISKIAGICEFFFEWGYKESIIKRFRTVIWHSAVLRILRRAVLDKEQAKGAGPGSSSSLPFSTPSRKGRRLDAAICGTPSKMIARHFSSLGIADSDDGDDDDDEKPLIVKIHSSRNHVSTDGLLEYRLQIAPSQLVHLAEMGIKGTREKPIQEWEDEPEQHDKDQESKDPFEHMRVWMPACMVRMVEPKLVEDFDEIEAKKAAKKANKGQGRARKKKAVDDDDGDEPATSPAKPKKAASVSRRAPPPIESDDEVDVLPSAPPKGKAKAIPTAAAGKGKTAAASTSKNAKSKSKLRLTAPGLSSDDESDDDVLPSPSRLFAPHPRRSTKTSTQPARSDVFDAFDSGNELGPSISPIRRTGDISKKNQTNAISLSIASTTAITSFFPASKSSARNLLPATQKAQIATSSINVTKKTTTSVSSSGIPEADTLRFFDDYDLPAEGGIDEPFKSDDLFTSRTPSPRKRGLSKSSSHDSLELNDDSFSDPPPLFPPQKAVTKSKAGSPTAPSSVFTSPSKSRTHSTLSISDSDSDSRDRYRKSPRKSTSHYSPAASRAFSRATSPTPQPRSASRVSAPVPNGPKIPLSKAGLDPGQVMAKVDLKTLPVYELSDEDDEDEVIIEPTSPIKRTADVKAASSNAAKSRADVPPLLRARQRSAWKNVPVRENIVIDLT